MIFGVTGYYCTGKDEFANFIEKEGFTHISLSDEIRKDLKKQNKRATRNNLINMGNEIRKKYGSAELGRRIAKKIKEKKDYVITSIRNKEEVLELRKLKGFILINLTSQKEQRFERLLKRKKLGDPKTFEIFMKKEKEEESNLKTGQQLHIVGRMADVIVNNNKSLDIFHMKIDRMLADWYPKFHPE